MAESMKAIMRAEQAEWKAAEVRTGGFLPVNQEYSMSINEAFLDKPKDKNYIQAVYKLEVIEGEYEGKKATKKSILKTAENKEFVKGELKTLKVTIPDDYAALGLVLENEVSGKCVKVYVAESKDKDGTPNEFPPKFYFNQLLEDQSVKAKTVSAEEGGTVEGSGTASKADSIIEMGKNDDEEALQRVIDFEGLNIDQNEYDTYGEVALLIIEQLGL